jgi:murein DD-endopeptidase MepM/ murein hydrolase activator NlpD
MKKVGQFIDFWFLDFFRFIRLFFGYFARVYLARLFDGFELMKGKAVTKMYQQRGKYATIFVHAGVVTVMALGVALGPTLIVDTNQSRAVISSALGNRIVFAENPDDAKVLGETVSASDIPTLTQVSDKPRSDDEIYTIIDGDTLASIAEKFGVSQDTIKWANGSVTNWKIVKVGQKLTIPPVTGVIHIVKSGETIYSVAKKYTSDAQSIVDFPFNTFTNDETFALAVGQRLVVPDAEMPKDVPTAVNTIARTPDAGTVTATGSWIWPAAGRITQPFRPWHKGADIANRDGGPILAADAGTVVVAGWPDNSGYGNRVVVNHGNGFLTLYAHMSRIDVVVGQRVNRGDKLGMMGSTGRSTGTHLHFEIRTTKGNADPLAALK